MIELPTLAGKWRPEDSLARRAAGYYTGAGDFSEGLAPVSLNRKWGYVDKAGRNVIKPMFDEARGFIAGVALVKLEGKWALR